MATEFFGYWVERSGTTWTTFIGKDDLGNTVGLKNAKKFSEDAKRVSLPRRHYGRRNRI